jgi:late competence protein required for DNA uptake (superfamily II DNA/RNA helicase)
MILNLILILAFIGILSGLSRLFKQEEIDLDNKNKDLVKCYECGDYLPKNLAILFSGNFYCKNCRT